MTGKTARRSSDAPGHGPTPADLPLGDGGTTFIEASAGTGKTHALTTLVARLVVEEGQGLDRILVVTFTRAATAELRDRIRRTLGAVLDAVKTRATGTDLRIREAEPATLPNEPAVPATSRVREADTPPALATSPNRADPERSTRTRGGASPAQASEADPQAQELLARWERAGGIGLAGAARRLEAAMHDVDRAGVYTIHGFCQRVLADLAFESGFPFGFEVSGGDGEMVVGAVQDFWRRRLYPASTLLVRHAMESGFLPRGIAEWASTRRSKVGVTVVGGEPPPGTPEEWEARWRGELDEGREVWLQHREAFRAELLEGDWLNRGRYRRPKIEADLQRLDAMFAAPAPGLPEEGAAGRCGRARLSGMCRKGRAVPEIPLFDALDRLEEASRELRSGFGRWLRWARREVLAEVRETIRRRIREDRRLGYDDLLIELHRALDGADGARLAARIRREFPCALIDEYQDTDPLQARIFARIYGEGGDGAGGEASGGGTEAGSTDAGPVPRPTFIVVGDPKQSIYRFRGADVFAYLAARRTARERLHLEFNWRSVPALVEGVNVVFAGAVPFVAPEIEYRPVAAARDAGNPLRTASGDGGAPLRFRLLSRTEDGKLRTKENARPVAVGAAANEIVRLLELAAHGKATIEGEPLTGADVAVLVRTREQGRLVAEALRERGVRSVEIDDGSVFDTREAEQIERLLWALVEPGREAGTRGALAGDPFGFDARALLALDDDEGAWMRWTERLADWRSEWESRGIGAVLLRLLEREGGARHLLGHRDGARRLTNFRHLAELLQEAETRERFSPAGLAAWLSHRRRESDRPSESALLRLESDEQLVRVLTVHGAKGLEFPVVFCPFAWDARDPERGAGTVDATYHLDAGQDYREVLDLDPDEHAVSIAWIEEFSESVRLLYVALTRARYRCVVTWGQVNGAGHSPLAWLLHRAGGEPGTNGPDAPIAALEAVAHRFTGLGASDWIGEMEAYARRFPDAISVTVLDPDPPPVHALRLPESQLPALAAREPGRPLRRIRQLTSFTALSAEAFAAGSVRPAVAGDDAEVDRPDHDQRAAPADDTGEDVDAAGGAGRGRTAFTFPRGPVAGSCLHRIFERLDEPFGDGPEERDFDVICRETLEDFGIGREWSPVARAMVERTRAVCLHERGWEGPGGGGSSDGRAAGSTGSADSGQGAPTRAGAGSKWDADSGGGAGSTGSADLGQGAGTRKGVGSKWEADAGGEADSDAEPGSGEGVDSNGADGGGSGGASGFRLDDPAIRRLVELEFHFPVEGLDRERLAARLVEHGYPHPFAPPARDGAGEHLPPIHGFLRGYVDLVVEHAGRWYILDYKSNWLGPTPADYGPEALAEAVRAGGYPLQYLIYLVALHRYLATRLPGYDYERHVGGAFYLFVRGIDPAAGMSRGVYFDRPAAACLHALDECFRGGVT